MGGGFDKLRAIRAVISIGSGQAMGCGFNR